ncbi:hypothetical protein H7J75_23980 [Mycolicibacterium canariasense]|uniref:hypothetical protein n=1 Tax=Mycolicibacterium canariasense TaxID=228230 RepID=UPI000786E8AB|nr:hypothetical protein [Mycolicibacterium canariasense]MCV7211679.1 hypothetical protein [Mycolicibacterium canariasense]ORV08233.1 hypothetical protein AWB94_13195 [Mycolicibacterium canariasense]
MGRSRRLDDDSRAEFAAGLRLRISDYAMRMSNSAPFRNRATRNYETRRARHRSVLPTLKDGDEAVADELRMRHIGLFTDEGVEVVGASLPG